ncbi:MAG: hypothetical protein NC253_09975 [Ruminococcus sp.]|nr:hypothetical protein [Ruminococcus sp.]MCM1381982.1 hypothetical protein [Muribaculaceae bacterium]MCM1478425.1 hypothetical protein [Muribaculaceae bacterium]
MGQTDIQFKNDLRKELLLYKQILKYLDKGELDELRELVESNIERVNAALQD